jgi:non-homologous end joining protein Ku
MAQRSIWTGKLWVSALFGIDVSIVKAFGEDPDNEGFKQVCECHQQPFKRTEVCVGGNRRLTKDMEAAGDTDKTTRLVKAVVRDGSYYVVPDDQIKLINDAVASKVIRAEYRVPVSEAPIEQIDAAYYVRAEPGSEPGLNAIHTALGETGEALVGQWTARTVPRVVLIHPMSNALVLNTVRYASQVLAPDERVTAHLGTSLSAAETQGAVDLLNILPLDNTCWQGFESEAVNLKQKIVASVLAGKPAPKRDEPEAGPAPSAGLLDQLNAALAAAGGASKGQAKPKPAPKRKAAAAPLGSRKAAARKPKA